MNVPEPQALVLALSNRIDTLQACDGADAIMGQLKHALATGNHKRTTWLTKDRLEGQVRQPMRLAAGETIDPNSFDGGAKIPIWHSLYGRCVVSRKSFTRRPVGNFIFSKPV